MARALIRSVGTTVHSSLNRDLQYGTIVDEQGKAILESQIDPEEGEDKPYVSNANGALLLQRCVQLPCFVA